MRVFCINSDGWEYWHLDKIVTNYLFGLISITKYRHRKADGPEYGDIDVVLGQSLINGRLYYKLAGWETNGMYIAAQFYPISELEEEVPEEKVKELAE